MPIYVFQAHPNSLTVSDLPVVNPAPSPSDRNSFYFSALWWQCIPQLFHRPTSYSCAVVLRIPYEKSGRCCLQTFDQVKMDLFPKHESVRWVSGGITHGTIVCMYSTTAETWFPQCCFFSVGNVPNMFCKVLLNLSGWGSPWGWYGVVLDFFMPNNFHNWCISLLSKSRPWSEWILTGSP